MNKLYIKEGYYDNGSLLFQEYFLDQEMTIRHNDDGPAYIEFYENGNKKEEFYYLNGNYHNDQGPALIRYWVNGDIKAQTYWLQDSWLNVNSLEELKRYIKINNIS